MDSKERTTFMATKKRIELRTPNLLNEMEDLHSKMRLKIERCLRISHDQEAVRRILREIKEML